MIDSGGTISNRFTLSRLKGVSMKVLRILLMAVFVLGVAILSIFALQDVDLVGTWNGKMEIPNFGPYEMTLVLEKTNSEYKGTVPDIIFFDLIMPKIDGNKLSCTFDLADGSTVYLTLDADGDTMNGEAEREGSAVSCVFIRED